MTQYSLSTLVNWWIWALLIISFLTKSEAKSCTRLLKDGFTSNGVYTINPDGGKPIPVLCDMTTDGGGWTVFQRRLDGSVDFYRDWKAYKEGFGSLSGEFWLGNDNLHRLTNANDVMLRVDLEDFEGNITYAEYKTFKVADEADKYRLTLGEYSGIPSCIIRIVNSQEIHWYWMCCVLSLFWAESMINQKRFLNSVSSSFLIFFK